MSLSVTSRSRTLLVRLAGIALVAGVGIGPQPAAYAGSATATLPINASVAPLCIVSAGAVNFGAYDPLVANASTPLDAQGTVTVQCVRNTSYSITLDQGQNGSSTARNMLGGTSLLNYELYSDSGHTSVWNTSSPVTGTATSLAPLGLTVYGRIPGGQDVAAAAYSDSISVTVNF